MIYLRAGLAPLLRDGRSNLPQCNCVTSGIVQIIIFFDDDDAADDDDDGGNDDNDDGNVVYR